MKIISKHKDYYDYLTGIYGIDEIMVYDRRTSNLIKSTEDIKGVNGSVLTIHRFAICNRGYVIYQFENNFYHTVDDIIELDKVLKKTGVDEHFLHKYYHYRWAKITKGDKRKAAEDKFTRNNGPVETNKALRQPVLIVDPNGEFEYVKPDVSGTFKDTNKKITSNFSIPDLSTFGFAKFVPADEMYQQVVAFIGWMKDHPEIPNNQTDKEKIQSAGFDDKISFRHRK